MTTSADSFSSLESQSDAGDVINLVDDSMTLIDLDSDTLAVEYDDNYGLVIPEQMILVRAYSDDTDDRVLDEIKPKFIVMFEPDMDFVRRIEVKILLCNNADLIENPCRCTRVATLVSLSGSTTWFMVIPARNTSTSQALERKRMRSNG